MTIPRVHADTGQNELMTRDAFGAGGALFGSSLEAVHRLLSERFADQDIRIYEAGGGSTSYLPTNLVLNAETTVVDVDKQQLRNNCYARFRICGDIQRQNFQPERFDLIGCYNVIEHLEGPDQAITHFFKSLVPGGLVFIAGPNPHSFFGTVTRFAPHWFHVWAYRTLLRRKDAGQPGVAPFRTVYDTLISPANLVRFCRKLGFEILYFKEIETVQFGLLRRERPALGWMLNVFIRTLEFISRKTLRNGDFHLVLMKPDLEAIR